MKKILALMSLSFLLQACVAVPAPSPSTTQNKTHPDFYSKYADRFSSNGIKQRREQEYAQKLAALRQINPVTDAQKAIATKSYYFLAYQSGRGGSIEVPGLTQQQAGQSSCELKQIDGMGDTLYGVNHQKYRAAIRHYANRFNRAMQAYCR